MTFEILCMATIALLFGAIVAFGGYRLFLVLLPFWGFFAGFFLGAQTIQFLFSEGFLATITGWVVGFIVGLIFAVLSYLFYAFAVAIVSFMLGYGATESVLQWIGMNADWLVWLIAVVVGVIFIGLVLRFNLAKYAIIVATAFGGTSMVIYTLLAVASPVKTQLLDLIGSPVKMAIDNSFWWLLFFILMAGAGIVAQIRANRNWEVEEYNRFSEYA